MRRRPRAIVLGKDIGPEDQAWFDMARQYSVPLYYDACDNILVARSATNIRTLEMLRRNIGVVRAMVFTTPTLRDAFAAAGFPQDRSVVIADMMLDSRSEIAATAQMSGDVRTFHRFLPGIASRGWAGKTDDPARLPERRPGLARLVWFGLMTNGSGQAGREVLPPIVPALNAVHADRPFDMLLVTRNPQAVAVAMADARFGWHYVPWSMSAQMQALADSDMCVLPMGDDEFCLAKSANRALLALASGRPVVTGIHPAYDGMADALYLAGSPGEWRDRLVEALVETGDEKPSRRDRIHALEARYGPKAVATKWARLLEVDGISSARAKASATIATNPLPASLEFK